MFGKSGLLAATALFFAAAAAAAALGATIQIPQGPGSNLVHAKCQTCHDLQYVVDAKGLLPAQWKAVLASMKDYGMEVSEQEQSEILAYLTTYLGQHPPPAKPAAQPQNPAAHTAKADGKTVFQQNCATCHGASGRGQPGYFPPLVGNPDLSKNRAYPVLVVLHGISGPITVEGRSYNGSMPSFDHLSNAEIAAVVNYVRGAWGNRSNTSPVTPELVARQREESLSPAAVHARRGKMESE